jgi:hypothetical protein
MTDGLSIRGCTIDAQSRCHRVADLGHSRVYTPEFLFATTPCRGLSPSRWAKQARFDA